MQIRRIGLLSLLLTVLLLSLTVFQADKVFSQGDEIGGKGGRGGAMALTPEQREKIRSISNKFSPLLDDIQLDLQRKQLDLVAELKKDEPDRKKIDDKLGEISALQRKRHKVILDEYFAVRTILTPEQNRFYVRRLVRSMVNEKAGGPGGP